MKSFCETEGMSIFLQIGRITQLVRGNTPYFFFIFIERPSNLRL